MHTTGSCIYLALVHVERHWRVGRDYVRNELANCVAIRGYPPFVTNQVLLFHYNKIRRIMTPPLAYYPLLRSKRANCPPVALSTSQALGSNPGEAC